MKVFKVTAKNLKLLMRSKTSMLVIVLGPLMIMLLVGFAFNNNSVSKLNVGYYSSENTELTSSFIDTLRENPSFVLINYSSEQQCVEMIQQGKVHLCVIFPNDFKLENNKSNELQFYVDQSRINFVYSIIDTVSSKLDVTSTQLSYQMTTDLINVIDDTKKTHELQLASLIKLKAALSDASSKLSLAQSKLDKMDFSGTEIDTTDLQDSADNLKSSINDLNSAADDIITAGNEIYSKGQCSNASVKGSFNTELSSFKTAVNSNATGDYLTTLLDNIDTLTANVDILNTKLTQIKSATGDSSGQISENIKTLNTIKTSVDDLKASIESNNAKINALKITNAESIVNPIKTTIKPVSTKTGNLSFIFPYFIILIIVFIGIMLSSNLIIMEKTSRAYFRNFTTPTKDLTFVMSIFLTSFIVVVLQLVFILALAYYFLNAAILSTPLFTILLLFEAISLFILIGMVIGYASNNQDSATMIGISVGSVLLFLSNLILPIEAMSPIIQNISKYNPYVLCSELLKKLTMFNTSFNDIYMDLILIGAYIVVLFILVMIIEKALKIHFISSRPVKTASKKDEKTMQKYLKLKNGTVLMSTKDLYDELTTMTDKDFEQYVNKKHNAFETWLKLNKNKTLSEKIGKCKTRKEMLAVLVDSMNIVQAKDPIAVAGSEEMKNIEKEDATAKDKDAKDTKKK